VLLLAVAAGIGGWWYGSGRYTTTPGVINLSAAQAEQRIEAAGLVYREGDPAYSETVAEGDVISTEPAGGSRILDGGTVTVVISLGKERYEVPIVRGMPLDAAKQALAERHLEVGDVDRKFSSRVRKGTVLGSTPESGTMLKPGRAVDLVVSKGPRPIKVPDFTGKDAERAEKKLTALGFEVEATSKHDDTVPEGDVITQTPSSGTLFRGDVVELTVSKGPVLVEVPDLTASGVEAATEKLKELGFQVRTEPGPNYLGLGFVSSSDPAPGTMAPKGSVVTLYLV
jgi:serine/threonine-protein kinase